MTNDDIDKLWNQAMRDAIKNGEDFTRHRFANLVAAHKAEIITAEAYRCGYKDGMEASAVICENLPVQQDRDVRDECAAAIRARGNT